MQGVIGCVVVVVVDTKIAKSGDVHVGTWASCKSNKSVEFGKKLASVHLESSGTVYKRHKECIYVGHHGHTH